jgi:hypothetical protein
MKYRLKSTDWTNHLRKTGFNVPVDHFVVLVMDKCGNGRAWASDTHGKATEPTLYSTKKVLTITTLCDNNLLFLVCCT